MAEQPSYSTTKNGKRLIYIDGVGWRYATEHRMTRWPLWKDSRKPGTYMITLNINGSQKLLGTLAGSSAAIYGWMKEHPEEVKAEGKIRMNADYIFEDTKDNNKINHSIYEYKE